MAEEEKGLLKASGLSPKFSKVGEYEFVPGKPTQKVIVAKTKIKIDSPDTVNAADGVLKRGDRMVFDFPSKKGLGQRGRVQVVAVENTATQGLAELTVNLHKYDLNHVNLKGR